MVSHIVVRVLQLLRGDLELLAMLSPFATNAPSKCLINRLTDLVLNLLRLLPHVGVPLPCLLPLMLLLASQLKYLLFKLGNFTLSIGNPSLTIDYSGLCSLEFLLEENNLMFVTLGQFFDGFLVAALDSCQLPI